MDNNPEKQANQLLQCLTQDKKPLALLLGAGCPFSVKDPKDNPLIPDIKGLTGIVKKMVCCADCAKPWGNICSQLEEDGKQEPNIEDILSRVRGLRDYAGAGDVRGLDKNMLVKLEKRICDEIVKCVSRELPNKSTSYHHVTAWVGAIDRSEPVEIFTTNYDLLIEQALEELRIPFFDGFVGSRQPFFDPHAIEFDTLPPRWARLWKIHGSINWRSETVDGILRVWRTDIKEGGNVVIHPSHLKYEQSRKMPYIAMMDRLRRFLSTPSSALIIVGYSFRDQHLNDVIVQGLQGTPSAVAFALMCDPLSNCSTAISLAKERANLCLIAKDGAVIRTKEALWEEAEEQPDLNLPGGAVEWTKVSGENDSWKATFNLGDFRHFGSFLQDLSGIKDIGR